MMSIKQDKEELKKIATDVEIEKDSIKTYQDERRRLEKWQIGRRNFS